MERIRRRVVADPNDIDDFGTAYTTYYVHERVRYPRYLCYDCHRPNYWAWWDGFDPYYTHCSVFDFRVNWSWAWGPAYWCGSIPYYVYTVRYDCPPHYRDYGGAWYSAWDGWGRWCNLWGPLKRYKSPAPVDYIPPDRYREAHWRDRGGPPGFLTSRVTRGNGARVSLPIGHNRPARGENEGTGTRTRNSGLRLQKPGVSPDPVRQANGDPDALRPRGETERPRPAGAPREEGGVRVDRNRRESAAPVQRPRGEQPQSPRYTPRGERNAPPPRYTPPPSDEGRNDPPPRGRNEPAPTKPPRDEGGGSPPPQATKPPRNDPPPAPPPRGNDSGVQRGSGGKGGSGSKGANYQRGGGGRSGGGSRSAPPSRSGGSGARGNRG